MAFVERLSTAVHQSASTQATIAQLFGALVSMPFTFSAFRSGFHPAQSKNVRCVGKRGSISGQLSKPFLELTYDHLVTYVGETNWHPTVQKRAKWEIESVM